ncbi:MAG: rhamnulokinase, partial [Candidatus Spyradocola sp.]
MGETNFLAMDFGASSGRAMLGTLADGKLTLRELHRFSNDPVELAGRLYWDVPRLFFEIKRALNKAALEGVPIASVGIDTWGVDYGLLDGKGRLIDNPVHYRDDRTEGMMQRAFDAVSKQEIYERTG